VITRTCNNYGPYQQFEKFIPTALKALIEGRKIPVYGDGLQVREWIHVSDNCRAITKVLEEGQSGSIYNIGTSRHIKNLDLARLLIMELGLDENSLEFVPDRPGHDQRYSISSAPPAELVMPGSLAAKRAKAKTWTKRASTAATTWSLLAWVR
jgi:dTDP-glucose 4,6-dehydratase